MKTHYITAVIAIDLPEGTHAYDGEITLPDGKLIIPFIALQTFEKGWKKPKTLTRFDEINDEVGPMETAYTTTTTDAPQFVCQRCRRHTIELCDACPECDA